MNKFGIASLSCLGTLAVIAGGTAVGLNIPTIKDKVVEYLKSELSIEDTNSTKPDVDSPNLDENVKKDILIHIPEEVSYDEFSATSINENVLLIYGTAYSEFSGFYIYDIETNKYTKVCDFGREWGVKKYFDNGDVIISGLAAARGCRATFYYKNSTKEAIKILDKGDITSVYNIDDNKCVLSSNISSGIYIVDLETFEIVKSLDNVNFCGAFIKMEEDKYLVLSNSPDSDSANGKGYIYDYLENTMTPVDSITSLKYFNSYLDLGNGKYILMFSYGDEKCVLFDYSTLSTETILTSTVYKAFYITDNLIGLSGYGSTSSPTALSIYNVETNEIILTTDYGGYYSYVEKNSDGTYTIGGDSVRLNESIRYDAEKNEIISYDYTYIFDD